MRVASILLLAAFVSAIAFSQDGLPKTTGFGMGSGISGDGSGVSVGPISKTAVVTAQPYSAEGQSQNIRTLADGTHIANNVISWKLYRDSAGRMREEHVGLLSKPPAAFAQPSGADPNPPRVLIQIYDPAAHVAYTLDSTRKVAHRRQLVGPASIDKPQQAGESAGTQTIEGVVCEGTRTTKIWPIGAAGNDRPLSSVTEVWKSPEMQLVVLSKVNNPLTGERTQKLVNLTRAEPPADLFKPPADYQVEEDRSSNAFPIGGDVSAPHLISKVEPQYTEEARQAKYSGSVLVSVVIDENGIPGDIKVVRPLGLGLDEKAVEAVSRWRFRPGMKGGVAVKVHAQIEVNFRLLDNPPF